MADPPGPGLLVITAIICVFRLLILDDVITHIIRGNQGDPDPELMTQSTIS
jgi:hypothetical protein